MDLKKCSCKCLTNEDGKQKTPEEKAKVFRVHFKKLFSNNPSYDSTVLEDLSQIEDCDTLPTDKEIAKAVKQLKNSGPGESGMNTKVLKYLLKSPETYALIKKFVMNFWMEEEVPCEWELGIFKIRSICIICKA